MRGTYGIADAGTGGDPLVQVACLLAGGCRLIQLRCKGWDPSDVRPVARAVRSATREAGALFLVNDWPELAAEVGADGVHVGQADAEASAARSVVGEGALVGVSHNTVEEVRRTLDLVAAGVDYVAVGPMWDTGNLSRPKAVRGLELLRAARGLTALPVVAIGGVTAERVPALREAGADAWAVIGAIAGAADRVAATRAFVDRS